MYKKILAPLDGSKLSECTFNHIKAIATGCEVPEVELFMVVGEPGYSTSESANQAQINAMLKDRDQQLKKAQSDAQDYLDAVAAQLDKSGVKATKTVAVCPLGGSVPNCILDKITKSKPDLVIMSTHGRSGVSRWAFGSVTEKVVRASTVPVLTVTPGGCRAMAL